jgi:hypothetical protein
MSQGPAARRSIRPLFDKTERLLRAAKAASPSPVPCRAGEPQVARDGFRPPSIFAPSLTHARGLSSPKSSGPFLTTQNRPRSEVLARAVLVSVADQGLGTPDPSHVRRAKGA